MINDNNFNNGSSTSQPHLGPWPSISVIYILNAYLAELFKRDLPIEIFIGFDDSAIDQLLKLHIVQVTADHHLQHSEQFTVRNEPVIVDVINLERET